MKLTGAGPYCSSCFGQYPDRQHVDFEAYWDGPVINGSVKVAIDDLIVCENCVKRAAELLGMTEGAEDKLAKQRSEIERLKGDLAKAEKYNKKLQEAFEARPTRQKAAA